MARPKVQWRSGSRENFAMFCERYTNIELTFNQYLQIIHTFFLKLTEHILETGDMVKLRYGLGKLSINKYKKRKNRKTKDGREIINLPVDWKSTKELWAECPECKEKKQRVFHTNAHTDGWSYYWMWDSRESKIKYKSIWSFELMRLHSRKLSSYLLQPNSKYKDIYNFYHRRNYHS